LYASLKYLELIRGGYAQPIFENPQKVENSILMFASILGATALILLLIKLWKKVIKLLEFFSIFIGSWIAFTLLFPFSFGIIDLGLIFSIVLVGWRVLKPSLLNQNISLITSAIGVGAIVGASLTPLPSTLLLLLVSIYDTLAVFFTKHMVYLAKEVVKSSAAFTLSFPPKGEFPRKISGRKVGKIGRSFHVGGGDLVIPLIFSASLLRNFSIFHSLFVSTFSTLFFFLALSKVREKKVAIPMMPWLSCGCLLGFILSLYLLPKV